MNKNVDTFIFTPASHAFASKRLSIYASIVNREEGDGFMTDNESISAT